MAKIRIAGITRESVSDGPGIRLVVFTQGCHHRCEGCHNPETWDFEGGRMIETSEIVKLVKENPLLSGITLSGGEPFLQAEKLIPLVREVKDYGKNVVIYTGYTFEKLLELGKKKPSVRKLLSGADYLIDGPFIKPLKTLNLPFRGSSNQRFIDLKKTFLQGNIFEYRWEQE